MAVRATARCFDSGLLSAGGTVRQRRQPSCIRSTSAGSLPLVVQLPAKPEAAAAQVPGRGHGDGRAAGDAAAATAPPAPPRSAIDAALVGDRRSVRHAGGSRSMSMRSAQDSGRFSISQAIRRAADPPRTRPPIGSPSAISTWFGAQIRGQCRDAEQAGADAPGGARDHLSRPRPIRLHHLDALARYRESCATIPLQALDHPADPMTALDRSARLSGDHLSLPPGCRGHLDPISAHRPPRLSLRRCARLALTMASTTDGRARTALFSP